MRPLRGWHSWWWGRCMVVGESLPCHRQRSCPEPLPWRMCLVFGSSAASQAFRFLKGAALALLSGIQGSTVLPCYEPFVSYSNQVKFHGLLTHTRERWVLRPPWLIRFRLERESFLRSRVAYCRIMLEEGWPGWELWQKLDISCEYVAKPSFPSSHKVKCRSHLVLWSELSQWFKEAPLPVLSGGNKK